MHPAQRAQVHEREGLALVAAAGAGHAAAQRAPHRGGAADQVGECILYMFKGVRGSYAVTKHLSFNVCDSHVCDHSLYFVPLTVVT